MLDGVRQREILNREAWLGWRKRNINASEAACLWGDDIHPHLSAFKLWAQRSGRLLDEKENPAMVRGRRLEKIAVEILAEQRPDWEIWQPGVYLEHAAWRIGATPDVYALRMPLDGPGEGNVQIKTIGRWQFENRWRDPDTREVTVPLWIAVQATIETLLSGFSWAAVAVLVVSDGGALDLHVIDIPLKPGILTNLRARVDEFWLRVENQISYEVDYFKEADTIFSAYRDDSGPTTDLSGNERVGELLARRAEKKRQEKLGENAREARRGIDAELVMLMGNAKSATFGGTEIVATRIKKQQYTVAAQDYRFIRIKEPKNAK